MWPHKIAASVHRRQDKWLIQPARVKEKSNIFVLQQHDAAQLKRERNGEHTQSASLRLKT